MDGSRRRAPRRHEWGSARGAFSIITARAPASPRVIFFALSLSLSLSSGRLLMLLQKRRERERESGPRVFLACRGTTASCKNPSRERGRASDLPPRFSGYATLVFRPAALARNDKPAVRKHNARRVLCALSFCAPCNLSCPFFFCVFREPEGASVRARASVQSTRCRLQRASQPQPGVRRSELSLLGG